MTIRCLMRTSILERCIFGGQYDPEPRAEPVRLAQEHGDDDLSERAAITLVSKRWKRPATRYGAGSVSSRLMMPDLSTQCEIRFEGLTLSGWRPSLGSVGAAEVPRLRRDATLERRFGPSCGRVDRLDELKVMGSS